MKGMGTRLAGFLMMGIFILVLGNCREKSAEKAAIDRAEGPVGTEVLALIGQEEITKADLEAAMARIPERRYAALKGRMLDTLISERVFAEEARRMGLQDDPEIQSDLARARKETLARYFIQKHVEKEAEPSEEELRNYYDAHQDEFVVPDGVLIQEIVTKTKDKAEAALKALGEEGATFEQVAGKYSIARTWEKGGRRGWIYKGKDDPDVEKVAFGLAKDAVSGIFEADGKFQIIKVLDKKDEYLMSFEDAKEGMRIRFAGDRKMELIHQYYEEANVDMQPSEPGVLVKIGEESIPESHLIPVLGQVPGDPKLRQRWARYLVETTVFANEAEKAQLEKDPEVARELKRGEASVLSKAFYKKVLGEKTQIGEKEIADYYEAHSDQFKVPEKVRVQAILVKTKEEAEEALEELEDSPSFAWVAVNMSLYPEAATKGGDIGWFSRGQKDPALEEAAFSLEKGQVSGIIKTQAGYEIIKVMDKRGGHVKPLAEVGQQIRMMLLSGKMDEVRKEYYEKAGVKILGQ